MVHDVLSALADLKEGRVRLNAEQQSAFMEAIEGLLRALLDAPRGGDPTANALWYGHERTPALARFVDAARPGGRSLAAELEDSRAEEIRLIRQLRADLGRY